MMNNEHRKKVNYYLNVQEQFVYYVKSFNMFDYLCSMQGPELNAQQKR